jgi:hypothetical protein
MHARMIEILGLLPINLKGASAWLLDVRCTCRFCLPVILSCPSQAIKHHVVWNFFKWWIRHGASASGRLIIDVGLRVGVLAR